MAAGDCLLMTREFDHIRKTAIISLEIRNLISHFLTNWFSNTHKVLTLYRMGYFGAAHGSKRGEGAKRPLLAKICHSYPTMTNLGSYTLPKQDPKYIWIMWHTSWILLTSAFSHWKSVKFAIPRNTDIDCILIHKS